MLTGKTISFRMFLGEPAKSYRNSRNHEEPAPDVPSPVNVWYDLGAVVAEGAVADPDRTIYGGQNLEQPTHDIDTRPK